MPPAAVWVNGILIGSTIVMMASGLVLVLSVMGIMNWTHGQFYMIGAFIVYTVFVKLGLNYFFGLLMAAVVVTLLGVVIEKYLQRPLMGKGFLPVSVVSLGLIFVLEGIIVAIFGTGLKSVPTILQGVLRMGPVSISVERSVLVGLALGVMFALYLFISRTKTGLAIRAAAQEPVIAGLYGVRSGRLFTIVMAIGSTLAAIAGGLMAPVFFVDPWIGGGPLFTALIAIVIGGFGSFKGAVAGGLILGFFPSVMAYYIGPWYELLSFTVVILIILFRPQGIFGQAEARL